MRRVALLGGLVAVAVTVALALAVPAVRGQVPTLKIVSSLPRNGSDHDQVGSLENAVRLAIDEIGGSAGGFKIEYQALDDAGSVGTGWDPRREAQNAAGVVRDPDVMAYIGPFHSGAARVAIPILNRAHLVIVSPTSTYAGLTRKAEGVAPSEPDVFYPTGVRNFARVIPPDDQQGPIGATWAHQLGAQRAYVLDDGTRRGRALALGFAAAAAPLDLAVVGAESIDPKASAYHDVASRVRAATADLVYFSGMTQNGAGRLLKDLRAVAGPDPRFMGSDGLYNQAFLDDADEAAEGAYLTFDGVPPASLPGSGADWARAYGARYGAAPGVYAPYAYDATRLVLRAISTAAIKDREAIRAAVFATVDFDALEGRYSIDQNGDTTLVEMSGRQVRDGRFDEDNTVVLTTSPALR